MFYRKPKVNNTHKDQILYRGRYLCILFMTIWMQQGYAQLFPGLKGTSLVEAIQDEYTPTQLLNENEVKDTLYAVVFSIDDSVRCIYSGLSRYLPTGVDPSQWLYGTGLETASINLEHGWPQAKGAGQGTNGNMDMHHLYPSRTEINGDRANFPFKEINDNQVQKWYFLDQEMNVKPTVNINAYSEFLSGSFEPRESVKGDIARAMFYFWTIYRDDAMAADPLYFNLQLNDLCQWHAADPVDEFETLRNGRIALYQDGKINPFILDCSLAQRAYCSALPICESISTEDRKADPTFIDYDASQGSIYIQSDEESFWQLQIIDVVGRILLTKGIWSNGSAQFLRMPPGMYIAYASQGEMQLFKTFFVSE